jgi:hypothetical protein
MNREQCTLEKMHIHVLGNVFKKVTDMYNTFYYMNRLYELRVRGSARGQFLLARERRQQL